METAQGATPEAAAVEQPTDANAETAAPETLLENTPEPAEGDSKMPPPAEPEADPIEPLKKALESERGISKKFKAELKTALSEVAELKAEILKRDTGNLSEKYQLNTEQFKFVSSFESIEQRTAAAKSVGKLHPRFNSAIRLTSSENKNRYEVRPSADGIPTMKHPRRVGPFSF